MVYICQMIFVLLKFDEYFCVMGIKKGDSPLKEITFKNHQKRRTPIRQS